MYFIILKSYLNGHYLISDIWLVKDTKKCTSRGKVMW